jgi:hypothetical protein
MVQPVESFVNTAPSQTMPGATPLRMILDFEFNQATGTYQQVNVEVVAASDPITGLPVRLATAEQMEDLLVTMRALLRCEVAVLNELSGRETKYDIDDFLSQEDEGSG